MARAVDRGDRGPVIQDKVSDLLARQATLECQHPAIIDDRDVEALPLAANIDARPHSHATWHAWHFRR